MLKSLKIGAESIKIYFMTEQVAGNKLSLLPKNILQNTQTLKLFTMNIKTESIYKKFLNCQASRLRWRDLVVY
jgi:hypothetical protein